MSLFDPLTPEERKRINDIRSGEIIVATPVRLQSLLDYMIGKEVDSWSDTSGVFTEIIASGSVVAPPLKPLIHTQTVVIRFTEGIEITVHRSYRYKTYRIFYYILIAFPNQDLNRRPLTEGYYEHTENFYVHYGYRPYYPYQLRGPVRTRILRLINKWKKREGF